MSDLTTRNTTNIGDYNCEKHGPYKWVPGHYGDPCPKCRRENAIERIWKRSNVPWRFIGRTFENYRTDTDEQRKALNSVREYADTWKERLEHGAGLVLCGKPGTGKTHLACALIREVVHRYCVGSGYVTAADMLRRIKSTYQRGSEDTEEDLIHRFSAPPLLVLDEIGVQMGTDHERQLLYAVMNRRYEDFNPTVLVSNLTAKEMGQFVGERIMDRMREGGGKIIPFNGESYRSKRDTALPTRSQTGGQWKPFFESFSAMDAAL